MRTRVSILASTSLFVAVATLAACGGDEVAPALVAFVGNLIDEQDDRIEGASVIVSTPAGAILSQTTTDVNGGFAAGGLEKGIDVSIVFSGPDTHTRTVFTAETEDNDMFLLFRSVFLREIAGDNGGQTAVIQDFTTAAGSTAALMTFDHATPNSGAMVRGRVVRVLQDDAGFYYVNAPGAQVSINDGAGTPYRVFFRGAFPADPNEQAPIEPLATATGEDARFVAFAVATTGISTFDFPAGPVTVTVTTSDGAFSETTIAVEDGITVLDFFTVP